LGIIHKVPLFIAEEEASPHKQEPNKKVCFPTISISFSLLNLHSNLSQVGQEIQEKIFFAYVLAF
jgi:hypothetical protein